ncbi:MAG: hypothetical protein FJY53_01975 [Betaproteobacteria bacterium]|nr:hypothetical protein [Betaproteobacteria bacterium]
MLIIRLIFVFLVITVLVTFGLYLLQGDKKYLVFLKKALKFGLAFLMLVGLMFVVRRILYV